MKLTTSQLSRHIAIQLEAIKYLAGHVNFGSQKNLWGHPPLGRKTGALVLTTKSKFSAVQAVGCLLLVLGTLSIPTTSAAAELPFAVVEKSLTVPAGDYQMPQLPVFIERPGPESSVNTTLTLSKGVCLSSGSFNARAGTKIIGTEVVSSKVVYNINKGALASFNNSVFSESEIAKMPGNFSKQYSVYYKFENCLFDSGFIKEWSLTMFSIVAKDCTISNWKFPTYRFHGDAYAVVEDGQKTNRLGFNGCHFRKCRIPVSLLWFCTKCTFEDCEFYDDTEGYQSSETFLVQCELIGQNDTTPLVDSKKTKYSFKPGTKAKGCKLPESVIAKTGVLGLAANAAPKDPNDLRTWTNVNGVQIKAKLMTVSDTHVTLLFNGKITKVPLVDLSTDDQKYAVQWAQPK